MQSNFPRPSMQPRGTGQVFTYFAALLIIANFVSPAGSLAQLPISYYLKDVLHLGPVQSAQFGLVMSIPLYGAFLFGMVRDRWSPFGLQDRGYFLLFAPIAALAYVYLAFRHQSYGELLFGALVITLVYRMLGPAVAGLTATVGQRLSMTGRISSLVNFVGNVIGAALAYLSGWVQHHFRMDTIFVALALASIALMLLGATRPAAVFPETAPPQKP